MPEIFTSIPIITSLPIDYMPIHIPAISLDLSQIFHKISLEWIKINTPLAIEYVSCNIPDIVPSWAVTIPNAKMTSIAWGISIKTTKVLITSYKLMSIKPATVYISKSLFIFKPLVNIHCLYSSTLVLALNYKYIIVLPLLVVIPSIITVISDCFDMSLKYISYSSDLVPTTLTRYYHQYLLYLYYELDILSKIFLSVLCSPIDRMAFLIRLLIAEWRILLNNSPNISPIGNSRPPIDLPYDPSRISPLLFRIHRNISIDSIWARSIINQFHLIYNTYRSIYSNMYRYLRALGSLFIELDFGYNTNGYFEQGLEVIVSNLRGLDLDDIWRYSRALNLRLNDPNYMDYTHIIRHNGIISEAEHTVFSLFLTDGFDLGLIIVAVTFTDWFNILWTTYNML